MAVLPIKILYLFPAIFLPLFTVCETVSPARSSNNGGLTDELLQTKLRISHLESVLDEINRNLTEKSDEVVAREVLIEALSEKIQYLESALSDAKRKSLSHDERIAALEEEVRLLWAVSRKNNFDIHILKAKVREAEEKQEEVTSQVETMSSIVSEQWIQIRHLEQAIEITKIKGSRVRHGVDLIRCPFIKWVDRFINQLLWDLQTLKYYLFSKVPTLNFMVSGAIHQFQRVYEETKKYHHELQRLIKQKMERNEYAAQFANKEVIFFLASALFTFPIFGAWMFLSSWFSRYTVILEK